ncbi:hypothetical protein H0H92_000711 [Tricholoma furcatifolium]|nr:hypothetical protein H0H92_000711 [Tricholoma furcatifolium]
MSDDLTPTLKTIRQKEFYSDPRFHASIAWALLENQNPRGTTVNHSIPAGDTSRFEQVANYTAGSADKAAFPTIPHFPKDLVPILNDQFSERLSATKTGTCDVETVTVKIGKEPFRKIAQTLASTISRMEALVHNGPYAIRPNLSHLSAHLNALWNLEQATL